MFYNENRLKKEVIALIGLTNFRQIFFDFFRMISDNDKAKFNQEDLEFYRDFDVEKYYDDRAKYFDFKKRVKLTKKISDFIDKFYRLEISNNESLLDNGKGTVSLYLANMYFFNRCFNICSRKNIIDFNEKSSADIIRIFDILATMEIILYNLGKQEDEDFQEKIKSINDITRKNLKLFFYKLIDN